MRILYLTDVSGLGGQENCLLGFARYIERTKFEPVLCCLAKRGWLNEEAERLGVKTYAFDIASGSDYPKGTIRLLRFVRELKPDIIHTQLRFASLLGGLAGRLSYKAAIISTRTYTEYFGKYRFLDYLSSRLSDIVVAVSGSARDIVIHKERIPCNKVRLIYNGIDLESFRFLSTQDILTNRRSFGLDGCCTVGMVSNLHPIKGHSVLIEAFAKIVRNARLRVKLVIIGKGVLLDELRQVCQRLGVENDVVFTGFIPDLSFAMSLIDIFAHPSINEGMSIVMMEAMAFGKPLVATRVGGTPELVIDKQTGFLVPPQDSEALSEALIRLIDDRDLACKMGQNAQERIRDNFTIQKTVRDYERLYEQFNHR